MQEFYQQLNIWVTKISFQIWSYMLFILFAAGFWLSLRTGFIQFRRLGDSFKLMFAGLMGRRSKIKREGDISPFAALSTALAATVGNGNIGGVATALFTGGPGAIFWMWVCGSVGMATKFSEALLGVMYRENILMAESLVDLCITLRMVLKMPPLPGFWRLFLLFVVPLPPFLAPAI